MNLKHFPIFNWNYYFSGLLCDKFMTLFCK